MSGQGRSPSQGAERRVLMGRVVGVFGVRGWLKIESYSEPRDRLFSYRPWLIGRAGVLREVGREVESQRHLRTFLALAPASPWATMASERLAAADPAVT